MIAAGVLLALQDDGLIDIDAPVADVTGWDGNPEITTAQLISNSSGLVGLYPNVAYPPYLCQFFTDSELEECGAAIFQTRDDDADIISPDSEFRYGGAQWQVAGAVAEFVSGKSWAELIDEIYVQPCGLETLGFKNHWAEYGAGYPTDFNSDPSMLTDTENPQIEGGAYATTGDYAKLLLMHLRGGTCGENQVVSQAALDTMHADRIAAAYDGSIGASTGYGMGWWIDRETGRISDGGAYGSVPWLDLADGYGAYLVIEADSNSGGELAGLLENVVDDAMNPES
jgi:CubicO group peptidase (beta-lactamase class C family)